MSDLRITRRRLIETSAVASVPAILLHVSAAAQDATPPDDGLVDITAAGTAEATEQAGTIVIAVQGNDTQTYQALADGYMALNPDVEVRVELKPSEGYQEFIRAQFAAGTPEVSLVNGNVVADLIQAKQFVDMSAYLDRPNPYTGGTPWRDSMDERRRPEHDQPGHRRDLHPQPRNRAGALVLQQDRLRGGRDPGRGRGTGRRPTPTSRPGTSSWPGATSSPRPATSRWRSRVTTRRSGRSRFGWLARMYLDQYTRHEAELVRAQPGDWNFREGIDDVWEYDPTDPHNDDANQITFNSQRQMVALRDHEQAVNGPEFQALYTNFKEFSDRAAPPGWLGSADAYPLFLTAEAAIRLDVAALLGNFERDLTQPRRRPLRLSAGRRGRRSHPAPGPGSGRHSRSARSTTRPWKVTAVDAPARTIEVNIGFLSVPRKDQAQNDLEMDFLMYLTSPEGFGIYLENALDPEQRQARLGSTARRSSRTSRCRKTSPPSSPSSS